MPELVEHAYETVSAVEPSSDVYLENEREPVRLALSRDGPAHVFRTFIRQGSLRMCQLLVDEFRLQEQTRKNQSLESELFEHIANVLIELSTRQVAIAPDVQQYCQQIIVEYAYLHLCSDNAGATPNAGECSDYLRCICDTWQQIKNVSSSIDGIDGALIQRLQVIHNQLFFLQCKPWLGHVPVRDVIVCMAIFISRYKPQRDTFEVYKLVLNKHNVLDAVGAICGHLSSVARQLQHVKSELLQIYTDCQTRFSLAMTELERRVGTVPSIRNVRGTAHRLVTAVRVGTPFLEILDVPDELRASFEYVHSMTTDLMIGPEFADLLETRLLKIIGRDWPTTVRPTVDRLVKDFRKGQEFDTVFNRIIETPEWCDTFANLITNDQRRVFKALTKCFKKVQQMRSVWKILYHLNLVYNSPPAASSNQKVIKVHGIKRVLQVIGESVKNTEQSPNMPQFILDIQEKLLSKMFHVNARTIREFLSHEFSLRGVTVNPTEEAFYLNFLDFDGFRAFYRILYAISVYEFIRTFCGTVHGCTTLAAVNALFQYTGRLGMVEGLMVTPCRASEEYFKEKINNIRNTNLVDDPCPVEFFVAMRVLVARVRAIRESDGYISLEELRIFSRSPAASLPAVRCLAVQMINQYPIAEIYKQLEGIFTAFDTPDEMYYGFKKVRNFLGSFDGLDLRETEKLADALQIRDKLSEPQLAELNTRLQKYYGDIFCLEAKYASVQRFLRQHADIIACDKGTLKEQQKQDQTRLQSFFDERRERLRSTLSHYQCVPFAALIKNSSKIPGLAIAAVQQSLLELCMILKSVGYFSDNLAQLKHRLPVLQGQNLRNSLAHDALSYNLLVDNMPQIIVNAYVMALTPIQLFDKRPRRVPHHFRFPATGQVSLWIGQQEELYRAAVNGASAEHLRQFENTGAALEGQFYTTSNVPETLGQLLDYAKCDDDMEFLLSLTPPVNNGHRLQAALRYRDYRTAFRTFLTFNQPNVISNPAYEELFCWEEIVTELTAAGLLRDVNTQLLLEKLLEKGNTKAVVQLIDPVPYVPGSATGKSLLEVATLTWAPWFVLCMLVNRKVIVSFRCLQYAMYTGDAFEQFYRSKRRMMAIDVRSLLVAAVKTGKMAIVQSILNDSPHVDMDLLMTAVTYRQPLIFERLLHYDNGKWPLAEAAIVAIRKQSWACLRLLVKRGISLHVAVVNKYSRKRTTPYLELVHSNALRIFRFIGYLPVDPQWYSRYRQGPHPMAIALRNGNISLYRYLHRSGFRFFHSSDVLHAAIFMKHETVLRQQQNQDDLLRWREIVLEEMFAALAGVDERCRCFDGDEKLKLMLCLLGRWTVFAYVEEPNQANQTVLWHALQVNDLRSVERLLRFSREARDAGELGVVSKFAFYRNSESILCCNNEERQEFSNILKCCDLMLAKIVSSSPTTTIEWQEVNFHHDTVDVKLWAASGTMKQQPNEPTKDNHQQHFDTISSTLTTLVNACKEYTIAYATIETPAYKQFFLKFATYACLIELRPPDPTVTELASLVNFESFADSGLLWCCLYSWNTQIVRLLLTNGADPMVIHHKKRMAPLHYAAANNADAARLFLEHCNVHKLQTPSGDRALELPDLDGKRPLHHASRANGDDVLLYLLQNNVQVAAQDANGWTPAMHCVYRNQVRKLQLLLHYGASSMLEIRCKDGWTLLHFSARWSVESLPVLLARRPNIVPVSLAGETPTDIAVREGNREWLSVFHLRCRYIDRRLPKLPQEELEKVSNALLDSDESETVQESTSELCRLVWPEVHQVNDNDGPSTDDTKEPCAGNDKHLCCCIS